MTRAKTQATIHRGKTSHQASERLLDVCKPGPNRLRHDSCGSVRAMGSDEAGPQTRQAATTSAATADAGASARAGEVGAGAGALIGDRATITTSGAHGLRAGHKITIAGVYDMVPDLRWWPRLRNWLLRRPAPTRRGGLTVFHVGEASSNTATISSVKTLQAGQSRP